MAITFKSSGGSNSTVSKLLDTVLPGQSTLVEDFSDNKRRKLLSSTSQTINQQQKSKLTPEEIRKLKKNQRLQKKKEIRHNKEAEVNSDRVAKLKILKDHYHKGILTSEENKELKKLVKRNVVALQTWELEYNDYEMDKVQKEILKLKDSGYSKKVRRQPNKKNIYEKKPSSKQEGLAGLTPGLAPVWMTDDDDSDDD